MWIFWVRHGFSYENYNQYVSKEEAFTYKDPSIVPLAKKQAELMADAIFEPEIKKNSINLAPVMFTSNFLRAIQTGYYIKNGFDNLNESKKVEKTNSVIKYIVPLAILQESDSSVCPFGSLVPKKESLTTNKITNNNTLLYKQVYVKNPKIRDSLYQYGNIEDSYNEMNFLFDIDSPKNIHQIKNFNEAVLPAIIGTLRKTYTLEQLENLGIIIVAHQNFIACYKKDKYGDTEYVNNLGVYLEKIDIKENHEKTPYVINKSIEKVYSGIEQQIYIWYYENNKNELLKGYDDCWKENDYYSYTFTHLKRRFR